MIDYVYKAKDLATNELVTASVKAESPEAAAKLLVKQHLFPLEVTPASEANLLGRVGIHRGVGAKDRILFTRQLSTLINAGLPLAKALRSVEDQINHQAFKEIINNVVAAVEGGSTLSQAFSQHPKVFNEIYIALVAAGETSGNMDKTLLRLADQQEKDSAVISKIRGAMIYPLIVFVLIIGVVGLMVTTVVPQVVQLYASLSQPLPLPTKALEFLAKYIVNFWWLNVLVLIGLVVLVRYLLAQERTKRWLDGAKMRVPVMGMVLRKMYMARFARTMSSLLASGVPMLKSLETTNRAVGNRLVRDDIIQASTQVRGGKALSESLESATSFLSLVPQMIKIGEESGEVDSMMERVAMYFENEVDEEVKNLSTTLEPVMMVVLGGIVALVLAAVLGPVYSLVGSGSITNSAGTTGSTSTTTTTTSK